MGVGEDVEPELLLNQKKTTLNIGETLQLVATVKPAGYDSDMFWFSFNSAVATVDQTGLVTAVAPGSTSIMVIIADGLTASCKVGVVDPSGIDSVDEDTAVNVNGRCIEAPAGSRVINLAGVEVGTGNLSPGSYIVILTDGRTQKVIIR